MGLVKVTQVTGMITGKDSAADSVRRRAVGVEAARYIGAAE